MLFFHAFPYITRSNEPQHVYVQPKSQVYESLLPANRFESLLHMSGITKLQFSDTSEKPDIITILSNVV